MRIPVYQVDAFAQGPFTGNPAAVCPLGAWLDDATMQAIAESNNLSETAFLVRRGQEAGADYDLRWFTPAKEVDLCGHATLASGDVVLRVLEPERGSVTFHTRSGPLSVARGGDGLEMNLPAYPPERLSGEAAAAAVAAVGGEVLEVWQAGKMLAVLPSAAAVRAARPDLLRVAALDADGLIVTASADPQSDGCDFVSRYFVPQGGIDEDPVTGSAHSLLAPFWAARLGKNPLVAQQVSARGGYLTCDLREDRVILRGRVNPFMDGEIAFAR